MENTLDQLRKLLNEAKSLNTHTDFSFDYTNSNNFGSRCNDFSNQVGASFQNDQSFNYGSNLNSFQPTFYESNYGHQYGYSNSSFDQNDFNHQYSFQNESCFYQPDYCEQNDTLGWNDQPSFSESFQEDGYSFQNEQFSSNYCPSDDDDFQTKFQKQQEEMSRLSELSKKNLEEAERRLEQLIHEYGIAQESDNVCEGYFKDDNVTNEDSNKSCLGFDDFDDEYNVVESWDPPYKAKYCMSMNDRIMLSQAFQTLPKKTVNMHTPVIDTETESVVDVFEEKQIEPCDTVFVNTETEDDNCVNQMNECWDEIEKRVECDVLTDFLEDEFEMIDITQEDPKIEITNSNDLLEECLNEINTLLGDDECINEIDSILEFLNQSLPLFHEQACDSSSVKQIEGGFQVNFSEENQNEDLIQSVSNVQNDEHHNDKLIQLRSNPQDETHKESGTQLKSSMLPCPYYLEPRSYFQQVPEFFNSHHPASHNRTYNSRGWCDKLSSFPIHRERFSHWSTEDRFLYSLTTLSL